LSLKRPSTSSVSCHFRSTVPTIAEWPVYL
jgi:hypothetical protein